MSLRGPRSVAPRLEQRGFRIAAIVVVLAVASAVIVGASSPPAVVPGVLVNMFTLVGLVTVRLGRRACPTSRAPWSLLLGSAGLNALSTLIWWSPAFAGVGETLGQPSIADIGWLISDQLLAGALLALIMRRETPRLVVLDVLTIAAGLALVFGVALIGPDFATSVAPLDARLTQVCYVVSDLLVISVALRSLLGPRPRSGFALLLAAAAGCLVASDIAWNWLTISGTYFPGSWGDTGWLFEPLVIALAALHPSARAAGRSEQQRDIGLHLGGALLVGCAALIAPLLIVLHRIGLVDDVDQSLATTLAVGVGGAALAVLVVVRFSLLILRARRLANDLSVALAETDRRLDDSETRYRNLVEQIPAVIYVYALGDDGQPPAPVYIGPQVEAITGLAMQTWLEGFDTLLEHIHADDHAAIHANVQRMQAGDLPSPVEFRLRRPDGHEIWLRDDTAVVTEADGARHVQGLLFDVTAAKHAEADRESMELELRLAQKLEAVGQLAAGIAHEINTPIQFVGDTVRFLDDAFQDLMGLTTLYRELCSAAETGDVSAALLARIRQEEDVADLAYLEERVPAGFVRAGDGIRRVAAIVGAMREFAHPSTAETAPVDLNDALRNTLIVANNEFKYVADVELALGELPPVLCNGGDVNQVFLNLIVNAGQAIAERVDGSGQRGTIHITSRRDDDDVLVSIGDTGGGIPAEVAGRVFDPFFTTKDVGRGTGQGLAIARKIVDRHGGELSFTTELGRGTTFQMRLPIGAQTVLAEAA